MNEYKRAVVTLLNSPEDDVPPLEVTDGLLVTVAQPEPYPATLWQQVALWHPGRSVTDDERRAMHQAMMEAIDTEMIFMQPHTFEDYHLGWMFLFSAQDSLKPVYQKERV